MNMIEKVAKQIFLHSTIQPEGRKLFWDHLTDDQKNRWKNIAKQAIHAMRDPNPVMLMSGADQFEKGQGYSYVVYQAMIEAALEDK